MRSQEGSCQTVGATARVCDVTTTLAAPADIWPCELCGFDACRVIDENIPDPHSLIGEGDTVLYLICAGADCFTRIQALIERDGGEMLDDSAWRPPMAALVG